MEPARAEVVAAPSAVTLPTASAFGDVLAELTRLSRTHLLFFRMEVGRLLATRFFDGNEAAYRDQSPNKESSFRRFLVTHREDLADLGLSDDLLRQSLVVWFTVRDLSRELVNKLPYSHVVALARVGDDATRQQLAQAAVDNEWKGTDLRKAIQATTAEPAAEPPAPVAPEAPYTPPSSLVLSGIERTTDELTRLLVQWEGVARVTPEQRARVTEAVGRLRAGADALERSLGRAESGGGRPAREPSR